MQALSHRFESGRGGEGGGGGGGDLPDIFKSNKKERKEQKHFIILGKLNPDGGGGDVHAILEFYYYIFIFKKF